MKKILLSIILCFLLLPCIYASDDFFDFEDTDSNRRFRINDRFLELGFNFSFKLSNNFLSFNDIFSEIIDFDMDRFRTNDLKAHVGANFSPTYFNITFKTWGFGFFMDFDVVGDVDFSGKMISFSRAKNISSDLNFAIFAMTGLNFTFDVQKFKVQFKPSIYYPLVFITPEKFSYTYGSRGGKTIIGIEYDIRIFSAFTNIDTGYSSIVSLTSKPGFDFTLGIQYPLSEETGLRNRFPILDFDVGINFVNVPIAPSSISDYVRKTGSIEIGQSNNSFGFGELLDSFKSIDLKTYDGSKRTNVERPFKMIAWALWRPFETDIVTMVPLLGFSITSYSMNPVAGEVGLKAHIKFFNMINPTIGLSYEDRVWKNDFNLAFNFRAIQLDIGAELQSPSLSRVWTTSGIGINFGIRIGW